MRKRISSGSEWENKVGYSRAVKVGNRVLVSGTTAIDKDGKVVAKGDMYKQTLRCIEIIKEALIEAGASLEDVVRTRAFITDIERWEEFGKAHGEFFENIKPTATLVEVSRLIDKDLLIEIEAEAVIGE